MAEPPLELSREDVLAALGYRGQALDAELLCKLDACIREAEALAEPRSVSLRLPLVREAGGIRAGESSLLLTGEDVRALLEDCEECFLLCATAGFVLEREAARAAAVGSSLRALLLDVCGSCAAEAVCDRAQDALEQEAGKEGKALTFRFAPGYGDLPLALQPEFVRVLNAEKRIGVSCSSALLLSPVKSVTAVLGITGTRQVMGSKCSRCASYPNCRFRREGTPCV